MRRVPRARVTILDRAPHRFLALESNRIQPRYHESTVFDPAHPLPVRGVCALCGSPLLRCFTDYSSTCTVCGAIDLQDISEHCDFHDRERTYINKNGYISGHYLSQTIHGFLCTSGIYTDAEIETIRGYMAGRHDLTDPWKAKDAVQDAQRGIQLASKHKLSAYWLHVRELVTGLSLTVGPLCRRYLSRGGVIQDYGIVYAHFLSWVHDGRMSRKSIPFLTDVIGRLILHRCGPLEYSQVAAFWRPPRTSGPTALCRSLWQYVCKGEGWVYKDIPARFYTLAQAF